MKLGATIGMRGHDVDGLARHAKRLEDAGVEYLWTGEAYTADAVSTLGFLAAVTDRAQLGSSILPIYSRTPTLLAMTAVGLDKLSAGRFVLGIGASGPQVIEGFHGVAYDLPLTRTAGDHRGLPQGLAPRAARAPRSRLPGSRSPKPRAPGSASR